MVWSKENQAILKLSNRIKQLRKDNDLTQAEVADRMEIEDGNYRKLENGKSNPTYFTLLRLCEALSIDLKEFFSEGFEING